VKAITSIATKVGLEKYDWKSMAEKVWLEKVWLQKYGCKVWLQPNFIDQSEGRAKCGKTNKKTSWRGLATNGQ
jgi:hypothetical protein